MRSLSKVLIGLGGAALAVAALAAVSPYLAMHRLQTALLDGDEEEIRDRVDFVKVREALQEDAAVRMLDDARERVANGGAASDRSGPETEKLIVVYATPKGLAEIAKTGRNPLKKRDAEAFGAQARNGRAQRGLQYAWQEPGKSSSTGADAAASSRGQDQDAPAPTWRLRWRNWSRCVVEVRNPLENGGLNLFLGRRGLFSWQAERLVFVEERKRPSEQEILKALGCDYDRPSDKTALCRLPASYRPPVLTHAFQPGGLVRTEVLAAHEAGTGDSARLLAVVYSKPDESPWGSLADESVVGAVQYRLVGEQWRVESANLAAMDGPNFDDLMSSEIKAVKVGKGRYGWTMEWLSTHHGEYPEVRLLALQGGKLQEVWGMWYLRDGGTNSAFLRSSATWRFDAASGGELFDIVVEHGAETRENLETKATATLATPWTERWTLVGDKYKSANPVLHARWLIRRCGRGHFSEAVDEYRRALEERTKDAKPLEWAQTQKELGDALRGQAEEDAVGAESARLRNEAVGAYRRALEVWTREAQPREWAETQFSIGGVQRGLGEQAGEEESARLLGQAVASYRRALEVWSADTQPQWWAKAEENLGYTLLALLERSDSVDSARILVEAGETFRRALQVWTKEAQPGDWARTQNNLGIVLLRRARQTRGAESARHSEAAAVAFRHALEVWTPDTYPEEWRRAQDGLRLALSEQANELVDRLVLREQEDQRATMSNAGQPAGVKRR